MTFEFYREPRAERRAAFDAGLKTVRASLYIQSRGGKRAERDDWITELPRSGVADATPVLAFRALPAGRGRLFVPIIIYGAVDTRTNELQYIGKTKKTLEQRSKQHLKCKFKDKPTDFIAWLIDNGEYSEFFIIEELLDDNWKEAERFWIAYFRALGCKLLNQTKGGNGFSSHTPETRFKISRSSTGRRHSKETRELISNISRAQWAAQDSKIRTKLKGAQRPAAVLDAMRRAQLSLWSDPEYLKKRSELESRPDIKEKRLKGLAAAHEQFSAECMRTPEAKENLSKAAKARWKNNRENMLEGCKRAELKRTRLPNGRYASKKDEK